MSGSNLLSQRENVVNKKLFKQLIALKLDHPFMQAHVDPILRALGKTSSFHNPGREISMYEAEMMCKRALQNGTFDKALEKVLGEKLKRTSLMNVYMNREGDVVARVGWITRAGKEGAFYVRVDLTDVEVLVGLVHLSPKYTKVASSYGGSAMEVADALGIDEGEHSSSSLAATIVASVDQNGKCKVDVSDLTKTLPDKIQAFRYSSHQDYVDFLYNLGSKSPKMQKILKAGQKELKKTQEENLEDSREELVLIQTLIDKPYTWSDLSAEDLKQFRYFVSGFLSVKGWGKEEFTAPENENNLLMALREARQEIFNERDVAEQALGMIENPRYVIQEATLDPEFRDRFYKVVSEVLQDALEALVKEAVGLSKDYAENLLLDDYKASAVKISNKTATRSLLEVEVDGFLSLSADTLPELWKLLHPYLKR